MKKQQSWEPITLEELHNLGARIDSEFVWANSTEEMYDKLNTHYPHDEWTLISSPKWCDGTLMALVMRPRNE